MKGLSYASGNMGKALIVGGLELTALIYLTQMIGVSPGLAGTALFVTQLIGAVLDPLVGRTVDILALKPYRAGPILGLGAVVSSISFIALYSLPLLDVRVFSIAVVLILAVRFGISLLEVPYNALLPRISEESRLRTSIAIWKFGFSTVAVLALSAIINLVLSTPDHPPSRWSMFAFGAICGLVGSGSVMLAWWRVRHCDRAPDDHPMHEAVAAPFHKQPLKALWHREYLLLVLVMLLTPFTTQLFIKSLAHRAIYLMSDPAAARYLLIALMTGQVPGLFLWMKASAGPGAARASAMAFALVGAGFALLSLATASWLAMAATFVIGLGAAGALSMIWSLAADCADMVRTRSGQAQESTTFGLLTLAGKFGAALASLTFGWGLSAAGMKTATDAPPEALTAIWLFNGIIPIIAAALCCWTLLAYARAHEGVAQR